MSAWGLASPSAFADLLRRTPLREPLRRLRRLVRAGGAGEAGVSSGYRPISDAAVTGSLSEAWQDEGIPLSQRKLVDEQLRDMHQGKVVDVFRVAAAAIRRTGLTAPSVLELGCASGYYGEVLATLVGPDVSYAGMDFSAAMIGEARRRYPSGEFVQGDATALPFADASYDILMSSALILHVEDYPLAIRETARVSQGWCVFHRTPVTLLAPTAWFEKLAYGVRVFEVCFNEPELLELFGSAHLEVVDRLPIDTFSLTPDFPAGEMVTYVCRKL